VLLTSSSRISIWNCDVCVLVAHAINGFAYLRKCVLVEHGHTCPLEESDISTLLTLILFPLRGEFDPGPSRKVEEVGCRVVWLDCIHGKGDLTKCQLNVASEYLYS
jgi:hypothetical protein